MMAFPAVPAGRFVAELHVQPAAGNYATIHVVDMASGAVLRSLFPPPPQGVAERFDLTSGDEGDGIDPRALGVLFDHAGDAWNAYAVVR